MKKTSLTEYKAMTVSVIETKIKDIKKDIANKKLDKAMDKLKDLKTMWRLRKEVAVLMTILNQKLTIEMIENEKGVAK